MADSIPWEGIIPAALVAASAVCFYNPEKFPSILFFCVAGFYVFRVPILISASRPATRTIESKMLKALDDKTTQIMTLGSEKLQLAKAPLKTTLKAAIVESLQDEELQDEFLATLTRAMIKATADENLKSVLMSVTKSAVAEALKDEAFIKEGVTSLVSSLVKTVKDEELNTVLLGIITDAVVAGLEDKRVIEVFRGVLKDCLKDEGLYRATAKGLIGAVNPFKKESSGPR